MGTNSFGDLRMRTNSIFQDLLRTEVCIHLNAVSDHRHNLRDDAVVGALGDIGMKLLVCRAMVLAFADDLRYQFTSGTKLRYLFIGDALGRQLGRPRLYPEAQLH